MQPINEVIDHQIHSIPISICPPELVGHRFYPYYQDNQKPQYHICPMCGGIHIGEPVLHKDGSLSIAIYNIQVAGWLAKPLSNLPHININVHWVAVHQLHSMLKQLFTPTSTQILSPLQQQSPPLVSTIHQPPQPPPQPPLPSLPSSHGQSLLLSSAVLQDTASSPPDLAIPSQSRSHQQGTQRVKLEMYAPSSPQQIHLEDNSFSSLDTKVQTAIISTSLHHLQQHYHHYHQSSSPSSSLSCPAQSAPPPSSNEPLPSPSSNTPSPLPSSITLQQSEEEWGTPPLLLDLPAPPPTSNSDTTCSTSSVYSPQWQFDTHSHPYLGGKPLDPTNPAVRRARRWISAISSFLKVHQAKEKPERPVVQQRFREMIEAIKEIEEEKDLMSYNIVVSTQLYHAVRRLAHANVIGQKTRPSDLARKVLECWKGRFPGKLPERRAGAMEADDR
ncbi:hypothetical protein BD311DRAFT_53309 [Dichomitus squalens]|uniref:Uncharacterized protein n=1 Tax=Dichomitus squalens TaxID=114155 RepID=A0A4Q9MWF5_9APHY|nr:hypothetical protein BD311DRAFT_53309 [Dichomitus squalens]